MSKQHWSRRQFLRSTGAVVAATMLPWQRGFAAQQADTLRLGLIGTGGQSGGDVPELLKHGSVKIVAVCDVDRGARERAILAYKLENVPQFADFREMLAKMPGELDAVHVATPDHIHAPAGLTAMAAGLHAYVQKPLTRSVTEAIAFKKAAAKNPRLVTQMGVQIHADAAYRTAVKWLQSGVIGKVREVHTFCSKGWGGPLPAKTPDPVPDGLDWELYCGVSTKLPFVKDYYHPGNWRKWQAFGTGTLGDMACHVFDPVFSAIQPGAVKSVVSHGEAPPTPDHFPYNAHIEWKVSGSPYTTPEITLHWYHGDTRPPEEMFPQDAPVPGTGSYLIGESGSMIVPHWAVPYVMDKEGKRIENLPPREPSTNHYHEWVDAALKRTEGPCGAHFGYAAAMTEVVLMGNIAMWWPNKTLEWDARKERFKGDGAKEANKRLLPTYRDGWKIPFVNG
jgi:predicted dehydrogenase